MGTYTPKRRLYKPDIGERGWGDEVNNNFDILDDHKHDASDITSGRLSFSRLPTVEDENVALVIRQLGEDPVYDKIRGEDIAPGVIDNYHLMSYCVTTEKFHPLAFAPNSDKVDGYHASTTPNPNTVPVSDDTGKLHPDWIPVIEKVWLVLNPINTSTRYIPYASSALALTTLTLTANLVYYIPFIPKIDCKITELAIEVTTRTTTGSAQIGVYNSTDQYRPYNLLGYISVPVTSTGVKYGSVNIPIKRYGLYWLAVTCSTAPALRAVAVGGIHTILGIVPGSTAYITYYSGTTTGGVLPTIANPTSANTGNVPAIFVKIV